MADDPSVVSSISARVPCSSGARLSFSWGLGTELRLCEIQNPRSGQGGSEPFKSTVIWSAPSASHKALAYTVAPLQKRLLHARDHEGSSEAVSAALAEFSRGVRQALAKQRAGAEGTLIALEHAIWQLLELFFIDGTRSEGYMAEDLALWLGSNGAVLDEMLSPSAGGLQQRLDSLLGSSRPDVLEDYWPCLTQLVAVGRMSDALRLMDVHDVMQGHVGTAHASMLPQYELLDALYILLRKMPRFRSGGGTQPSSSGSGREFDNMAEFLHYRSQWLQHCRGLPQQCAPLFQGCAAVNPRTEAGVRQVLSVLGGEDEAVLLSSTSHWLELLVAELLHLRPNCQARQHLRPLMHHCMQLHPAGQGEGGTAVLTLMCDLLEALIDLEVQRVVEVLSSSGAVSPWFMAHMYEVMRALPRSEQVMDRTLPLFGGDQLEYWRLLFAEMLVCQPSSVKLAVTYLTCCPSYGADAAEVFLEALPVHSDAPAGPDQVHRLLQLADTYGLPAAGAVVCRSAGAAAWYGGRLGEAAAWLSRGRDERRLAVVLEPVLGELRGLLLAAVGSYQTTSLPLESCEELEALLQALTPAGASTSTSISSKEQGQQGQDNLFVQLLRGFLDLQAAVRAVLELPASKAPHGLPQYSAVRASLMSLRRCVPEGLVLPLLLYVVPFLEAGTLAFTVEDVQELMRWLTDTLLAREVGRLDLGLHERYVQDVQLALTRALARSHVQCLSSPIR